MMFCSLLHIVVLVATTLNCCSFVHSKVCCEKLEKECFDASYPFLFHHQPDCPEGEKEPIFELFTRDNKWINKFKLENPPWETLKKRSTYRFLVHGWVDKTKRNKMIDLKDALLKREDSNVILVDWYLMANTGFLPSDVGNTRTMGAYLALLLKAICRRQMDPYFMCIGHSLGAHACGHAGQRIKINRIIGLDPTGMFFQEILHPDIGLSTDDADFVDVIHTNHILGTFKRLGHADFYANGGRIQPHCWWFNYECHHAIAIDYLTETVKTKCTGSWKCSNIWSFHSSCKTCTWCCVWGFDVDTRVRGAYWVTVDANMPYCKVQ